MTVSNSNYPTRFYSRKDRWLSIIIWGTILVCILTIILISVDGKSFVFDLFFALLMIGLILFILSIYFNTYYEISEQDVFIRSGIMKQRIPLESIKEMKKVTDILSSPALSSKRILIKHRKSYIGVQISPLDRDEFIDLINERIHLLKTK